jgi:hypothetical protein
MEEQKDNLAPTKEVDNASPTQDVAAPQVTEKAWFELLDNDLKSNPSVTKFKNPGDLAKSYIELQKTLGKDKIVVPTDKSTPEEWKAFFKKAGAPDKDDEYDVSDEDMPEVARLDATSKEAFRKAMHAEGYTKKQFDAAWKFYKDSTSQRLNQEAEALKNMRGASEASLRSEWGAAYDGKVAGAQKVIDTFFKDKGIRPEFSILANDKGFIKAMADIAEKIGEDVIAGTPRMTMTPKEAQSELNMMMMDKKHPLHQELHPEHSAAVEKFADLQALIMAGQAD